MKRTNSIFVVARLMLIVLTLAITVFSFASCEGLPPELQGLLGGNPNASCDHAYDNACDTDCNACGATRETEHAYDNACDTDCNICGTTRTTEHTYDNARDTDCNICGATRTVEPDNTRYTITEEEWNAALKLRNFTYIQATPAPGVEYKLTETAIHLSSGSNNMYAILKDGVTYGSEDGVNWKAYNDNFDSVSESYVLEHMIGHYGVTFTKFLEVYEYSEESKSYVRNLANGGTAEFSFADGKLVSFIANGQTPVQITNVGTTVVEYSAFNIVDEIKPTCQHANVENCVCKDCSAPVHTDIECIPAFSPTCYMYGIHSNVYGCNDCGKGYYDEELKNEIVDLNEVIIPALGHKFVGGVCERCAVLERGVGDNGMSPDPTPWELANRQLSSLYSADNRKATPSDYELVSKIVIEGEEFAVTWAIANESITITYDEANGVYVVDIPDEITENCYYSIEATICNSATGRSIKYLFTRLLEKNASAHQHPGVENCVCSTCNEAVHNIEFVSAKAPTCEDFGNIDFYICMDCNKLFSDAEAKNEITSSVVISAIGGEHNYVNGTCDKCGSSDPFGGSSDGQGGASESSSES